MMMRLGFFLLLLTACTAGAQEVPTPSGNSGGRATDDLRYESITVLAQARTALDAQAFPAAARVNLYVSQAGQSRLRIRQVRIAIDDQPAHAFDLALPEAVVLANSGELDRLMRSALPAGPHQVRAEFSVGDSDKTDSAVRSLAAEYRFDKQPGTVDIEFRLDPLALLGPKIKVRPLQRDDHPPRKALGAAVNGVTQWATDDLRYRSGSRGDPALSHVRHLARIGLTSQAMTALLEMQIPADGAVALDAEYSLETARELRGLGLLDRAEAICDQLDQQRLAGGEVATERLSLTKARLSSGELDLAQTQLDLARRALPEFRRPDWRYDYGMILLARQQTAEAIALLGETTPDTIDAFRYMNASTESLRSAAFNRFNLAVALSRSGDERKGLSWLDLLGRSTPPNDPQLLALRDKANLALGWHFLQAKQGRTALGVLGRVRSEGPSADRALLGMGWAQLAPDGERLPRIALGSEPVRAPDQPGDLPAPLKNSLARLRVLEPELNGKVGPRSFEREDPPKDRDTGLHRALNIWSYLLQRDDHQPEVLEAMLATAYAHDQLRDPVAAENAYGQAIAALRRVESDMASESASIGDGRLATSIAALADDEPALLDLLDRLHLPPDAAASPLYAALERQRDLGGLQAALETASAGLAKAGDTGLESLRAQTDGATGKLAERRAEDAGVIAARLRHDLDQRRALIHDYLRSALLLAARVQEQPGLQGREAEHSDGKR